MRLLQLQLGRVLDRDQALLGADARGQGVEQGGLARTGAAGNHHGYPGRHRALDELRHAGRHGAHIDQALQRVGLLGELADRHRRPVDGHRRDSGIDPAAVGQAGVDHGLRLVDTAADRGGDAVDDTQQVVVIAEADGGQFQLAPPLHIDLERAVDQDVGDAVVLEQRLQRTQPRHLVQHRGAQVLQLGVIEGQALGPREILRHGAYLTAKLRLVQLVQLGQVDLFDQAGVQAQLGVEQGVGRPATRGRLGLGRQRRSFGRGRSGHRLDSDEGRRLGGGAASAEAAHPAILSPVSGSTTLSAKSWSTSLPTSRTILDRGW